MGSETSEENPPYFLNPFEFTQRNRHFRERNQYFVDRNQDYGERNDAKRDPRPFEVCMLLK